MQYNEEDIDAFFKKIGDKNAALHYQNIKASSQIKVFWTGDEIEGKIKYKDVSFDIQFSPEAVDGKISFDKHHCSCGKRYCRHLAAVTYDALQCYPDLKRKPKPLPPANKLLGSRRKKRSMPTASKRILPTHLPVTSAPHLTANHSPKPETATKDEGKLDNKNDQWLITKLLTSAYDFVVKVFQ